MKIKFSNPKVENKKIEKKLLKIFKNVIVLIEILIYIIYIT